MKRFHFRLERVLAFRLGQAEVEKAKLVILENDLARMRLDLFNLNEAFLAEVRHVLPNPIDRAELGRYRMVVETQALRLNQRMQEKQAETAKQKERFLKANQAAEILTRVKNRQRKTWAQDYQKQLDSLAMDSYLARWKN